MLNIDDRLIKEVSPKVGANALSVLLAIAIHLNQKTNRAFPSHSRLMELTGLGRDAVYSALERLKVEGLLLSEQTINSKKKTFGRRVFRLTTRFIKIFVDACDAEPLPENPYTDEPYTDEPYTDEPYTAEAETYQLNTKEQISNKEQITKSEAANADTRPRHSDKPTNLETDTDLFNQIGQYYKANQREWTDSVCQVLPGKFTAAQLKSMLEDYCAFAFANRNKYATFAAHNANFKRWIRQQSQFEKTSLTSHAKPNRVRTIEPTGNYAPENEQYF